MFRSLHRKLVLVLVLLIVSVMAVVGTFLINSVTSYHIQEFRSQMYSVFTGEFILTLEQNAARLDDGVVCDSFCVAQVGRDGGELGRTATFEMAGLP